eukprot:5545006-Prorocentrum_lima.AAC.1
MLVKRKLLSNVRWYISRGGLRHDHGWRAHIPAARQQCSNPSLLGDAVWPVWENNGYPASPLQREN